MPREPFVLKAGESRRPGHLTMKATREDTLGAYALRENIAPPGFMVHPHRHQDTDEAWFLIDGELTFLGGSETFTLTTGGFIFVPRGHTHAFTNRAKSDARFLAIFSPAGLEEMFEELLELRANRESTDERRAEIRARYHMEEVVVGSDVWPPAN